MMLLQIFLLVVSVLKTESSTDVSMCQTDFTKASTDSFDFCKKASQAFRIGFVNFPPYIFTNRDGQVDGIFKSMFENYVKKVCPSFSKGYTWKVSSEARNSELIQSCIQSSSCDFALAMMSSPSKTSLQGAPVANFHTVPGIAFVTMAIDRQERIYDVFNTAFEKIWPIFVFTVEMIFLIGLFIWLSERHENAEDFPAKFVQGTFQACWWSLVSMTTVGYGKIAPITPYGRLFSFASIIFGIVCVGMVTSILTIGLWEINNFPIRSMRGLTVGCIDISPIARNVIIQNGGIARCYSNIAELQRDMALGYVHGLAMDTLELQYYTKENLMALGTTFYEYQQTYDTNHVYAIAHFPVSGKNMQECSVAYAEYNSENQMTMEVYYRNQHSNLFDDTIYKEVVQPKSVWIFDANSTAVRDTVLYTGVAIVIIIMAGIWFDVYNKYFKKKGLSSNKGYEKTDGEKKDGSAIPSEERVISEALQETLASVNEKILQTQLSVQREIQGLARLFKEESRKSRIKATFDRDKTFPVHPNFSIMFPSNQSLHSNNLNNMKYAEKISALNKLDFQY